MACAFEPDMLSPFTIRLDCKPPSASRDAQFINEDSLANLLHCLGADSERRDVTERALHHRHLWSSFLWRELVVVSLQLCHQQASTQTVNMVEAFSGKWRVDVASTTGLEEFGAAMGKCSVCGRWLTRSWAPHMSVWLSSVIGHRNYGQSKYPSVQSVDEWMDWSVLSVLEVMVNCPSGQENLKISLSAISKVMERWAMVIC